MAKTGPKRLGEMPKKQQRFVEEYLVDLNATQAAIRAGYSPRAAHVTGPRLLGNARVAAAIFAGQSARAQRTNAKADDVVRELQMIAYSDIGDVLDFSGEHLRLRPAKEIPEAARRAISSVKARRYVEGHGEDARTVEVIEFKLWPKPEALRDLGNHLGLFKNPLAASIDECRRLLARLAGVSEAELPASDDAIG